MRQEIERSTAAPAAPQLIVLCRSLQQLQAMLAHDQPVVYVDFPRHSRISAGRGDGSHQRRPRSSWPPPRIQKPGEIGIFHALARQQADGILVRNLAGLDFFASRGVPCICDYSLNAANELTVELPAATGCAASHGFVRPQPRSADRHGPPHTRRFAGSRHPSAYAHVPHGALRVLRRVVARHEQDELWAAVRSPRRATARPRRQRTSAAEPMSAAAIRCSTARRRAVRKRSTSCCNSVCVRFASSSCSDEPPAQLSRCVDLYRDLIAGPCIGARSLDGPAGCESGRRHARHAGACAAIHWRSCSCEASP